MKIVALQDVCKINPKHDLSDFDGGIDISFVGMADVSEISHSIVQRNTKKLEQVRKGFTHFVNDDVIIAKITPCYENGKIAVVNVPHGLGFGSTEFHVLRPDKSRLLPEYLFYFLSSPLVRANGVKRMTGSAGQKRVPVAFFSKLQLSLPSLEEQKRIVHTLQQADSLGRKRQKAISFLDDYLKAVFLEMFGDPVANPKGWEVKQIAEIASKEKNGIKAGPFGSSLKKEFYVKEGYKIYGQEQVIRDDLRYGDYYIGEDKYKELENCRVQEGDILISLVGTFGKISVVPKNFEPGIINPRLMKITVNQEIIEPYFLVEALRSGSVQSQIENVSHGGTMGIVNVGIMKQIKITVPDMKNQLRYLAIKKEKEHVKHTMLKQAKEIDMQCQALMQNAFNSKIN